MLAPLPDLKAWATDVEPHALSLAVNQGRTWPGFKLVEGRSIRKYSYESAIAQAAEAAGVEVWDRKLKTITALERQLGKKRFSDLLRDLVVKSAGKPTLVPEFDKRPALTVRDAATEFSTIDNNVK